MLKLLFKSKHERELEDIERLEEEAAYHENHAQYLRQLIRIKRERLKNE